MPTLFSFGVNQGLIGLGYHRRVIIFDFSGNEKAALRLPLFGESADENGYPTLVFYSIQ